MKGRLVSAVRDRRVEMQPCPLRYQTPLLTRIFTASVCALTATLRRPPSHGGSCGGLHECSYLLPGHRRVLEKGSRAGGLQPAGDVEGTYLGERKMPSSLGVWLRLGKARTGRQVADDCLPVRQAALQCPSSPAVDGLLFSSPISEVSLDSNSLHLWSRAPVHPLCTPVPEP